MLDISLLPMLQTSRDICGKKPLSFLRYSFIRYSRHEGLCFSSVVGCRLDRRCMYFRPIRLKLLWTTKLPIQLSLAIMLVNVIYDDGESSVLSRCFIQDYDNGNWDYDAIYCFFSFLRKNVFEDVFYRGYKQKSPKAAKRHLDVELASVFFMARDTHWKWFLCRNQRNYGR